MRPRKYKEFNVSKPYHKLAKHLPADENDLRLYVSLSCPYCGVNFKEVLQEHLETRRATECASHVNVCKPAISAGVECPSKRSVKNDTLYPNGYNLRHGSKAGEGSSDTAMVATGMVPFTGAADEARAFSDAWADVADMVEGIEQTKDDVESVCKDMLRTVHPDVAGDRSFSATEVAAMLNAVREAAA